ncbi:MAG: hypothetical protein M1837_004147 [Sclerophora amabilis]|nr:MAG: hypothetical protein M1837_004147 [Sclerophora amabilis]
MKAFRIWTSSPTTAYNLSFALLRRSPYRSLRCFSDFPAKRRDDDTTSARPIPSSSFSSLFPSNQPPSKINESSALPDLGAILSKPQNLSANQPQSSSSPLDSFDLDAYDRSPANLDNYVNPQQTPPHHFHIYATKHNTHITLTRPNRDPIISVSAGNIGFRKAGRGNYDAAYQLGAYVMNRIQEQGLLREIQKLEVILRGFGPGREAVTKALLGSEGRYLRGRVSQVTDATRLKFGGTRSRKPRRLG